MEYVFIGKTKWMLIKFLPLIITGFLPVRLTDRTRDFFEGSTICRYNEQVCTYTSHFT